MKADKPYFHRDFFLFFRKWLQKLKTTLLSLREYYFDFKAFKLYSATFRNSFSIENLQGLIVRRYHAIEVGLTYKPFRIGFGCDVIRELLGYVEEYVERFGVDWCMDAAFSVLHKYNNVCKKYSFKNQQLSEFLEKYSCLSVDLSKGGIKTLSSVKNLRDSLAYNELVQTRYSCREFLEDKISSDLYERVIGIALKSPSACNRQPCKVYVIRDQEVRMKLLSIQNNRSSWRENAADLLLVTASLGYYDGVRERNAPFVDGGLFCMNLLLALHFESLGACCLNMNLPHNLTETVLDLVGADKSEVIVMMIAVGKPPPERDVAVSSRRKVDEVLKYV